MNRPPFFSLSIPFLLCFVPFLEAGPKGKPVPPDRREKVKEAHKPPHCCIGRIIASTGTHVEFGTGILISPKHVLTAAHCVWSPKNGVSKTLKAEGFFDEIVFIPGFDPGDSVTRPAYGTYPVVHLQMQKTYQDVKRLNNKAVDIHVNGYQMERTLDIAVLELKDEVGINPERPDITFPKPVPARFAAWPLPGGAGDLEIRGYDQDKFWNQTTRPAGPIKVQRDKVKVTYFQLGKKVNFATDSSLFESDAHGTFGTSGGPLLVWKEGVPTVVGLVCGPPFARRTATDGPGLVGVLLDDYYVRWINTYIRGE